MSSPSTPRSTRSASPASESLNILTPGQKIKAMMAEFDSDSEMETHPTTTTRPISKLDFRTKSISATETRQLNHLADSDVDSEDSDDIVRPKGRMAARMQGNKDAPPKEDTAFSRLSNALRNEQVQATRSPTPEQSSGDELPTAASKRKTKGKTQHSPAPSDQSRRSHSRARTASPMFFSPTSPRDELANHEGADGEMDRNPKSNARFLALVTQKRKEREERERIEAEQKAAKRAQMEQFSSEMLSDEDNEADDPSSAKKLSQNARQPRKASKKALEEMSRETQRMTQTKKKITKESLFARFNFMQPNVSAVEAPTLNSSSTAGSQQSSDGEVAQKKNDTPHTSPILGPSDTDKSMTKVSEENLMEIDGDENSAETATSTRAKVFVKATDSPQELRKPFGTAILDSSELNSNATKPKARKMTRPSVRVLMSRHDVAQHNKDDSDSDDLEVVTSPAKARRIAAFENLPSRQMQESSSMTKLKALAHLTSPTRKTTSMTSAELSAGLLYRARQQAAKERRERMEELRAKGVVIETAEERAAMEDDLENLVEKARQEADDIARHERAARKKAQGLDEDDEDDDDFVFSGSDDNGSGEDDDEDDEKSVSGKSDILDQEADGDENSAEEQSQIAPSDVEDQVSGSRRKHRMRVISDDEDDEEPQVPSTPVRLPSNAPRSAERPQFPGMQSPSMSMGLTQAFAGTLADEESVRQIGVEAAPFSLPEPGRPIPGLQAEDSEILVRDSQDQSNDHDFMTNDKQNMASVSVSESPANHRFSQYSQLPDPTQDQGFVFSPFDPAKRFRETPPVSTVDTVLVGQSQSPAAERKRKQLRRGRAAELSVVEEEDNEGDFEINSSAFDVMKKTNKKSTMAFDKKNSKARGIVDEAAEESEDEYAGIGGASDDSDGEEDAYDQQMINDQSGEVVDEKQLAALNAEHQRNRDEKDVNKLMRDITTGALRRRRNADDDLDLDDSDDERLARRREKQREFAKMRRALLADDKIGALAENPKKAAFFKAIEDREMDDDFELDFLDEKESGSQSESQNLAFQEPAESAQDGNKRKRPLEPIAEDATNRPPPNLRRTPASALSKKPATLAEIRETLSFLTETPEYDSFHEDASIEDEEADEEGDSNTSGAEGAYSDDGSSQSKDGFAVPRHPRRTRGPVVDRLALLRQASSNSASTSGSSNTKQAFHSGNSDGPIGSSAASPAAQLHPPPALLLQTAPPNLVPLVRRRGGAVNSYTAAREQERERQLRMKQRNGGTNIAKLLNKHAGGGLGALAGKGQWD
ncbi:uncharacterized protein N7477_006797 [Penicillium maclennaniae]|uniref:uncharacterized protein n=1 Tax=Penicillium maclennaniae TaxID=1343394 RepID=UPI002540211A|nr:uncharacterized protein N7477_006797 [Penicillium maclennaniae]KAJ5668227.1 hypothetical protein N7477_006797 [Penicillium maclennaniae]